MIRERVRESVAELVIGSISPENSQALREFSGLAEAP
jgi:hypothetical protein